MLWQWLISLRLLTLGQILSLSLLAVGDIPINFQDCDRLVLVITLDHLAAFYNHLGSIFACMHQSPSPLLPCCQEAIEHLTRHGKVRLEQIMSNFSYGFLRCPSIEFLRPSVPEDDDAR